MKFIYFCILILTFVSLSSCQSDFDPSLWSKLGEIKLAGKDLKISVSKEYISNDSLCLLYIQPITHSSTDDYYGLMIAFNGSILHVVEKTESGGWGDLFYGTENVPRDENYFYLSIPNRLLFDSNMRMWSAYKEEVTVGNMKLKSKKTTKIDKNDPYRYIQITK